MREHFSAENSPSRYEFAVAREFFKELGSPFHTVVAMQAADGGNLTNTLYSPPQSAETSESIGLVLISLLLLPQHRPLLLRLGFELGPLRIKVLGCAIVVEDVLARPHRCAAGS